MKATNQIINRMANPSEHYYVRPHGIKWLVLCADFPEMGVSIDSEWMSKEDAYRHAEACNKQAGQKAKETRGGNQ
jgi:hypothetical protein